MFWTSDVGRPNLDVANVALRLVAVVEPHSPRRPVARCVSVSQCQVGIAQLVVGFGTFAILFTCKQEQTLFRDLRHLSTYFNGEETIKSSLLFSEI